MIMSNDTITVENFLSYILGEALEPEFAALLSDLEGSSKNEGFKNLLEKLKSEAGSIAFCVVSVLSLFITAVLCHGILRFIYIMKCLMLMCPSILKCILTYNLVEYFNEVFGDSAPANQKWLNYTLDDSLNDSLDIVEEDNAQHIESMNFGLTAFSVLDEILTFIFIHEIFNLVSRMEKKKMNIMRWMLKVSLGVVVAVVSSGIQFVTMFIQPPAWRMVVNTMVPLHSLLSLGITVSFFCYGRKAILILIKNQEFQKRHSSAVSSKSNYLISLIIIMGIFQLLKFSTRVTDAVVSVLDKENLECAFNMFYVGDVRDMLLFMNNCAKFAKLTWCDLLDEPVFSVLEFVSVFVVAGLMTNR